MPKLQTALYFLNKSESLHTQLDRRIDKQDGWTVFVKLRDSAWVAEASNTRKGKAYAGAPSATALRAIQNLREVLESWDIKIAL